MLRNPLRNTGDVVHDPLARNAPPVMSPAYIGLPSSRFSLVSWQESFANTAKAPIDKTLQLNEAAEALLAQSLDSLHEALGIYVTAVTQDISSMTLTLNRPYQAKKTEAKLEDLFVNERTAINGAITTILDKFDRDPDFKNDFKAAIGAEDDATARKTLETRLKSEQDKIKDQKKYEEEILNAIKQECVFNARARWAAKFRSYHTNEEGLEIKQLSDALSTGKDSISFKPGKSKGESFSLLSAFASGEISGSVYSIENGKHQFDPKDPAACEAFVACARAKNNGSTTRVTLTLGGGPSDQFAVNNTQNPTNSLLLREKAKWFMATLKYGLEGIPDAAWTGDRIKAYYDKHGELPPDLPDDLKKIDLEMPPIPFVEIGQFTPSDTEEAEFKRWAGLRDAMLYCEIKENEKQVVEGNLSTEECTTLNQKFEHQRIQPEEVETPTPTPH